MTFRKVCGNWGMGLGLAVSLVSCRGEVDKSEPGSCPLQCNNPTIAGAGYRIRPIGKLQSISCIGNFTGSVPLPGPDVFKFVVEAPRRVGAYNPGGANQPPAAAGLNEAELPLANTSLQDTYLPVNNISIQPFVIGPVYEYATNDENATVKRDEATKTATEVTPYKFAGVVTPKSQWCSDGCGVITMEVHFECLAGASAGTGVAIQSGSIMSEYQSFDIKHVKPDAALKADGENQTVDPFKGREVEVKAEPKE